MGTMYLMCGAPGCGKSYYIKTHLKEGEKIISRDEIRFSILKDKDKYFSKEKEVYNEFLRRINAEIAAGSDFYVDQTSLNTGARAKLLNRLNKKPTKLIAIYIDRPLERILFQNAQRTGRALVPEDAVINMYNSIEKPTKAEGFDEIWEVE